MIVDFHIHSTASDGTFSPAELAEMTKGFAAVALTDHDNCDGVVGWSGVSGIELSIEPGVGFDRFHLLGLGIDPANAELKAFLKAVLDGRNARNERIVANFRRLGIERTDISSYAHGEVLARPHFGRWLMQHGFVTSVKEAFERYLLPDSPVDTRCYEERWHPSQEDAFRVVHAAGGICVMAHPKYWRRDWKVAGADFAAAERGLSELKEKGLDGIEALYQANTGEENVGFMRLAAKLGFLTTAGSDFHGANKPTIHLGMEVAEAFVAPVLERLSERSRAAWERSVGQIDTLTRSVSGRIFSSTSGDIAAQMPRCPALM